MNRRAFLKVVGASASVPWVEKAAGNPVSKGDRRAVGGRIDRHALVTRHTVKLDRADIMAPLSLGNGEFAFTADVTGLQTFEAEYGPGIPLSTMAQWGFHAAPNPQNFSVETFPLTTIDTSGRPVGYVYYENGKSPKAWEAAANYLYTNPSRLHLGRVALALKRSDGHDVMLNDLTDIHQELDLWTGRLDSRFSFDGQPVHVSTRCHPTLNQIAVRIESPLIATGQVAVRLAFPYGTAAFNGNGADWSRPGVHQTVQKRTHNRRADFARTLDADHYHVALEWAGKGTLSQEEPHHYRLIGGQGASALEFIVAFSPNPLPSILPHVDQTETAAAGMWKRFWSGGGVIDLSRSRDPRWHELERRIVLSQYLTRIQCAGSLPPQETGLTCNSWSGKFHLEMHWWHAAHFPLWGRADLLERSLPFYKRILPKAQDTAKTQGYKGARWPKCVGPDGDPGPTYLECFLIWQQPHPIFYAELCRRAHPGAQTLAKYRELVFETAAFMASYAVWDETRGQYRIGPPLSDAPEVYFADHSNQWNPTFEVAYWRWGLETAQRWRELLGLQREAAWDHVLQHLPPLATRDGLYVAGATATETFTKPGLNTSHPCMLAPLGMLDGAMVDRPTMARTLHRMMQNWDWNNTWGWDYPMMAMTAARLGEGETALQALLMNHTKNTYLPNGHNFQMPNILPIYLPGNGGLLYAVAMMAVGWDGAPKRHAPGFPDDGSWTVQWEGLQPTP
jgi:hypothetical protein